MIKTENFEKVEVKSPQALRDWLKANHTQSDSIWLVTYKKHTGAKYVSTQQILDEVLCFGWIDGIRRKLDDDRTMQMISPRKAQHWAKSYKDRAARLIEEGRMHPAGLKSIEDGKASGLWNFMDDVDALIRPDDLVAALAAHTGAKENFDAFPDAVQRFALRWIKLAKKPETRTNRIEKTAVLAAQNKKVPGA
ncbi:MAG: YdeI/OmpD-associated family protein [Cyanobacteria bacterium J06632_22]